MGAAEEAVDGVAASSSGGGAGGGPPVDEEQRLQELQRAADANMEALLQEEESRKVPNDLRPSPFSGFHITIPENS